jgi:FdrA protein
MSAPTDVADSVRHVSLRSGVYADSVRLMQVSRQIGDRPGVTAVLVAMATPLNLELAAGMGLGPDGEAKPDQLLIALSATDDAELTAAVAARAPLRDLALEEPDIEEVVRRIYREGIA